MFKKISYLINKKIKNMKYRKPIYSENNEEFYTDIEYISNIFNLIELSISIDNNKFTSIEDNEILKSEIKGSTIKLHRRKDNIIPEFIKNNVDKLGSILYNTSIQIKIYSNNFNNIISDINFINSGIKIIDVEKNSYIILVGNYIEWYNLLYNQNNKQPYIITLKEQFDIVVSQSQILTNISTEEIYNSIISNKYYLKIIDNYENNNAYQSFITFIIKNDEFINQLYNYSDNIKIKKIYSSTNIVSMNHNTLYKICNMILNYKDFSNDTINFATNLKSLVSDQYFHDQENNNEYENNDSYYEGIDEIIDQ